MLNPTIVIDKLSHKALLALLIVALPAGAWFLGKRQGEREASALAASQFSSVEAQAMIDQLQTSLRNTELDLVETAEAVEVSMARTQTLRSMLEEQMRANATDAMDLDLYRQIEANQKPRAIEIESLSWNLSQPSILRLTLIQWMGRDRVAGKLVLSLEYVGDFSVDAVKNDEPTLKPDELTIDLDPVSFDFRFFQIFEISIPTDLDNAGSGKRQIQLPSSVNVRIIPAEDSVGVMEMRFPWSDVAQ